MYSTTWLSGRKICHQFPRRDISPPARKMRKSFEAHVAEDEKGKKDEECTPPPGRKMITSTGVTTPAPTLLTKFLGLWDKELVEKRDSMPLKFYFVNKIDELPVNRMILFTLDGVRRTSVKGL